MAKQQKKNINEVFYLKCKHCTEDKIYDNSNFMINLSKNICRECSNKRINIGKWKRKHNIFLDFDKMYDTYSPVEWYLMCKEGKFNKFPIDLMKINKCVEIVRYVINKEMKCSTRNSILSINRKEIEGYISAKILNVIGRDHVEVLMNSFPEWDLKIYEFNQLPKGFITVKENADKYMKFIIDKIVNEFHINSVNTEIPQLLKPSIISDMGFHTLYHCITKYKHYSNFYEWVDHLYPEWELKPTDFSIIIACDGSTICNSIEEKRIFDYLYSNYGVSISAIGMKRKNGFFNDKYNEKYYPDFKISEIGDMVLDKPIFIEYYGLYTSNINSIKHPLLFNYKEKIKRKNEFYKNNTCIDFIDLYPFDLNNDFQGVRDKLTPFLLKGGEKCIDSKKATAV
jgi:hypothetical protein